LITEIQSDDILVCSTKLIDCWCDHWSGCRSWLVRMISSAGCTCLRFSNEFIQISFKQKKSKRF